MFYFKIKLGHIHKFLYLYKSLAAKNTPTASILRRSHPPVSTLSTARKDSLPKMSCVQSNGTRVSNIRQRLEDLLQPPYMHAHIIRQLRVEARPNDVALPHRHDIIYRTPAYLLHLCSPPFDSLRPLRQHTEDLDDGLRRIGTTH